MATINASSSAIDVGLGLGESVRKELGDFRPRDHSFGFLGSNVSSQPDVRSSACGLGRGVLMISDAGRDIISGDVFALLSYMRGQKRCLDQSKTYCVGNIKALGFDSGFAVMTL